MTLKPIDGYAVILHLIEAARALSSFDHTLNANVRHWVGVLETYLAEQIPAVVEVGWEARTWGELLPGDTINAGSGEALVTKSSTLTLPWHLEPDPVTGVRQVWHPGRDAVDEESGAPEHCRACRGRCTRGRGYQVFAKEWSQSAALVTLAHEGVEREFKMPFANEIEVLRGPAGRAADESSGRHGQMIKADRDMVLASWAAEAYEVLAATGLTPEPVAMTMKGEE